MLGWIPDQNAFATSSLAECARYAVSRNATSTGFQPRRSRLRPRLTGTALLVALLTARAYDEPVLGFRTFTNSTVTVSYDQLPDQRSSASSLCAFGDPIP